MVRWNTTEPCERVSYVDHSSRAPLQQALQNKPFETALVHNVRVSARVAQELGRREWKAVHTSQSVEYKMSTGSNFSPSHSFVNAVAVDAI